MYQSILSSQYETLCQWVNGIWLQVPKAVTERTVDIRGPVT